MIIRDIFTAHNAGASMHNTKHLKKIKNMQNAIVTKERFKNKHVQTQTLETLCYVTDIGISPRD